MRVARIITSQQHGEDEDELKRQLQAAGDEVDVAAPGQAGAGRADLEVELQSVSAEQALDTALRLARGDADVYIAPGVLPQAPVPQAVPAVVVEQQAVVPEPMSEPSTAAEPQTQAEADPAAEEARGPSLFQRVGTAWAERQQRAQERRLQRELRAREEDERRRQQALELQRRREQEERARVERLRVLREEMAREATLRAQHAREKEESERRRAAELPRQVFRPAPASDTQRLAAMEAQMQPAARVPAVRRPISPPAGPRRVAPPRRRIASRRERQWQWAALLASLVALMAMLGFAAAMNLHPVEPLPAQMLQNNAQQQVPFGAATITPAKPASVAPVRASAPAGRPTAVSPARKPAPRPSAAREKTVRSSPRAHRSDNRVADDSVVVHHYASPNSAPAQSAEIRRYSDQ